MQHIESAILAGLLALVLLRMPIPWRADMLNVIIFAKVKPHRIPVAKCACRSG